MQRYSPSNDVPRGGGRTAVAVLGVANNGAQLSKSQKRFNQLVERLKRQREELRRWQAYQLYYQRQLTDQYQPLVARLREQRIAMAVLLDQAMDGNDLGKRERDKALYLLNQLVAGLLAAGATPAVVRLHDKYSAASFAELQQERMDALREAANEALPIDVKAYAGAESPAEFETWIEEQVRAAHSRGAAADGPSTGDSRKPNKRAALRERVAEGGTRAVREAYRKLVSELHPDREKDPEEQARKTELMQRVNQAYKAADLLALLELQLSLEQIDSAVLAGLADEQLRHYVHVLEEQARQLREELADLVEPFAIVLGESAARKVTIDAVQRLLDRDLREIKATLRKVEMDVICFRDVRQLKRSLGQYGFEPLDDDELDMPDDVRQTRGGAAGRGRRR